MSLTVDQLESMYLALQGKLEELEETRVFAVDREYDRQARWHATYNAALTACLRDLSITGAHDDAVACADRAHGPLEAPKVVKEGDRYVVPSDIDVEKRLDELTRADEINDNSDDVTALVKAAAQAHMTLRGVAVLSARLPDHLRAEVTDGHQNLAAALKPFEVE